MLVGSYPCRLVVARSIGTYFWVPSLRSWPYVTSESPSVVSPSYIAVPGSFTQSVDFSSASLLEFVDDPGVFYMVVGEQPFVVDSIYRRFFIAEASQWVSLLPANVDCLHAFELVAPDLPVPWDISGAYDLWYYTGYPLDTFLTFTSDDDGIHCSVFRGPCDSGDFYGEALNGDPLLLDSSFGAGVWRFRISGPEETGSGTLSYTS